METISLEGKKRTDFGSKATKLIRKEDRVPCVMYGGKENVHFSVEYNALKDIVYTDKFVKVGVSVDGMNTEAILKDIDVHPVTDKILHVDFQELVANTPVKVQIPIKTTGSAAGVKLGGKLELKLRKLAVKALPKDLVSSVEIDVTPLEMGKSLKVRDLKTDLEVMNPAGIPIAAVVVPRAMRSAATKDAKGVEVEEGSEEETTEEAEA